MGKIYEAVGAAAVLVLMVGCGQSKPLTAAVTTVAPTPRPSTYFGETATAIAIQIKGCADVTAGDVGGGGPGLASTATCMLNGRTVTINSWSTVDARDGVNRVLQANAQEAYYAQGEGWTVTATDNSDLQRQMTNDVSGLLANALSDKTPSPPDLPGQKASADAVVASLDGTVVHVSG